MCKLGQKSDISSHNCIYLRFLYEGIGVGVGVRGGELDVPVPCGRQGVEEDERAAGWVRGVEGGMWTDGKGRRRLVWGVPLSRSH